ncbi:hypothetical protein NL676_005435 [Syzygium grande]|nr:hypothetical protein NL676_005435 [Syzygium grande]
MTPLDAWPAYCLAIPDGGSKHTARFYGMVEHQMIECHSSYQAILGVEDWFFKRFVSDSDYSKSIALLWCAPHIHLSRIFIKTLLQHLENSNLKSSICNT